MYVVQMLTIILCLQKQLENGQILGELMVQLWKSGNVVYQRIVVE